jgi:hypothetical protein
LAKRPGDVDAMELDLDIEMIGRSPQQVTGEGT